MGTYVTPVQSRDEWIPFCNVQLLLFTNDRCWPDADSRNISCIEQSMWMSFKSVTHISNIKVSISCVLFSNQSELGARD